MTSKVLSSDRPRDMKGTAWGFSPCVGNKEGRDRKLALWNRIEKKIKD